MDTRVGIDGFFALVYGLADEERIRRMKPGFERLLGPYGIRTVAPDEKGYREDVYWRGACWPKSCSLGMYICTAYYPDLVKRAYDGIIAMCLAHPSIWECYNVRTGELARSDHGFVCTPGVSSNVGAGELLGTLWIYHGLRMYDEHMALPLLNMRGFHHAGLRIDIQKTEHGFEISAESVELDQADVSFIRADGRIVQKRLTAGKTITF